MEDENTATPEVAPEGEVAAPEATPETTPEPAKGFDLLSEDGPDWLKNFNPLDPDSTKEPVTKEELDELVKENPKFARLIARTRHAALERVTQAAQREEAAKLKETAANQSREAFETDRAQWRRLINTLTPEQRAVFEGPKGDAPDPWTKEGQEFLAQKQVADTLQKFFKPFQDAVTKEVEDHAVSQRLDALTTFADKNPDLLNYVDEIKEKQTQFGGPAKLDGITAYHMIKAEEQSGIRTPKPAKAPADPLAEQRAQSRAASPRREVTKPAENQLKVPDHITDPQEIAQWYMDHPAAMEAELRRTH